MTKTELAKLLLTDYKSPKLYFIVRYNKSAAERYGYSLERTLVTLEQADKYYDELESDAVQGFEIWWKNINQICSYAGEIYSAESADERLIRLLNNEAKP